MDNDEKLEEMHTRSKLRKSLFWQDFGLISIGAVLLLLLILLSNWTKSLEPVRWVLGLATILYFPGYCLTAALFPGKEQLDPVERVGLSLGLSIALVPLIVIGLNEIPWGMRLFPILIGEYLVMALGVVIAIFRRSRLPISEVYRPQLFSAQKPTMRPFRIQDIREYAWVAASLLLIGILFVWINFVSSQENLATDFYITEAEGSAAELPGKVVLGDELAVTLGITNHEGSNQDFRVEVWVEDTKGSGRRKIVFQTDTLGLSNDQEYNQTIGWQMPWSGEEQKVEFQLYREDNQIPLRTLWLWVNVLEPAD